jgi:arylsulfatase A-like enzyme
VRPAALAALMATGCGAGASRAPAPASADLQPPAAAAPERVLFDLIANRPRLHVVQGGALELDPGSPAFWKYAESGWSLGADGERRVAEVVGIAGVVHFVVEQPASQRIFFRLKPAVPRQALTVLVNDRPVANLALGDGWQSREAAIPAALLHAGENAVRFHFRAAGTLDGRHSAAAFARIAVAPEGRRDPGALPRLGQPYGLGGDVRRALAAQGAARFSYYLVLPSTKLPIRLRFAYGAQSAGAAGQALGVRVRVARDGAAARELWRGEARAGWQSAEVELSALAGEALRLDLELDGGGAFGEPRLTVPASAGLDRGPRGRPADHVLVWMVDALRADKLAPYNPSTRVETPALAALAREGARFASATAQGNYCLPSQASLLSGTYPVVHTMIDDRARLPPSVHLISERLKAAGIATAMFSSNGYLSDKWGLGRGWDAYRNFIREGLPNSALEVWKAARPWLESQAHAGHRTFLYLATVEPHVSYDPPAELLKRYFPKPYRGPIKPASTAQQLAAIKRGRLALGPVDKEYLQALYDAEVAQSDAALAHVIADLKAMQLWDRTALVVVSDHGEEFFEHGSVGHGHSLYQELLDVPLLVRYPPLVPAGVRVDADAELLDVAPTVLELAGVEAADDVQGESLIGLCGAGAPRMPRPAVSAHGPLRSLKLGRYKLVTSSARASLYDLVDDPREQRPVEASRPIALRALGDVLALERAYEPVWHKPLWGVASDLKPAFADELH